MTINNHNMHEPKKVIDGETIEITLDEWKAFYDCKETREFTFEDIIASICSEPELWYGDVFQITAILIADDNL